MSETIDRSEETGDVPEGFDEESEDAIRGTFVLAMLFLLMVVLLFFWTYGVLLDRAG
jgi:hypothetical protein